MNERLALHALGLRTDPLAGAVLLCALITLLRSLRLVVHRGRARRRAVTRMGGGIAVSSTLGAGTTVHVTVDLDVVRKAQPAPAIGPLVMVADDDDIARYVAARKLERLGYRVRTVAGGADAIAALDTGTVDAILMDCAMPDIDGLEATRRIRQRRDSAADVPIIALTSTPVEDGLERCLRAGMDGCVAKPASREHLVAALQGVGLDGGAASPRPAADTAPALVTADDG